ncbi:MAG: hypothetical protein QOE59_751, partial [Actinomycetota bacterium]|nr:hypothetical protein [Actinomycetota bacterium]
EGHFGQVGVTRNLRGVPLDGAIGAYGEAVPGPTERQGRSRSART